MSDTEQAAGADQLEEWVARSRRKPERQREAAESLIVGLERAFSGDQFTRVSALLGCFGVAVWLPEAGGPVDLDDRRGKAGDSQS